MRSGRDRRAPHLQEPQVLLLAQELQGIGLELWSDDHLAEDLGDGLGARQVQRTIDRDDPAEGRLPVRGKGPLPGLVQIGPATHAAGVGVLEDGQRWCLTFELRDQGRGGRQVEDVVVRQLLAVQLLEILLKLAVQSRFLVRVLPVAERLSQRRTNGQGRQHRVRARELPGQMGRDGRIVGRRAGEHLGGQRAPQLQRGLAGIGHLFGDDSVVGRIHHHRHAVVVLGGTAEHRRTADVDVLDGVVQVNTRLGHRRLEGVEVHHHQIDGQDAVLAHRGLVDRVAAQVEQSAVNPRVQRLHPTVQHLREAGVLGDVAHRQAGITNRLSGSTGGEQFHAGRHEGAGEGDESGFVGDGKQGTLNTRHTRAA